MIRMSSRRLAQTLPLLLVTAATVGAASIRVTAAVLDTSKSSSAARGRSPFDLVGTQGAQDSAGPKGQKKTTPTTSHTFDFGGPV
jgi:hypothetical protein